MTAIAFDVNYNHKFQFVYSLQDLFKWEDTEWPIFDEYIPNLLADIEYKKDLWKRVQLYSLDVGLECSDLQKEVSISIHYKRTVYRVITKVGVIEKILRFFLFYSLVFFIFSKEGTRGYSILHLL